MANGKNGKDPGGAPTKYKKEYAHIAYEFCKDFPSTDKKLADILNVCEKTVNNWKKEHPKFLQSIQKGKDEFNSVAAEKCLFKLVNGFRFTEVTKEPKEVLTVDPESGETKKEVKLVITKKVRKFIPPNERSIRFFLKNRDPARWRDTQAVEVTGRDGKPIEQRFTHFPNGPLSLADWEAQVKEMNEKAKNDTQKTDKNDPGSNEPDSGDNSDGMGATTGAAT